MSGKDTQKTKKRVLRESEENLRTLINNLPPNSFIYTHDVNGVFTFVSHSITDALGYSVDDWLKHYTTYLTDDPINREVVVHTDGSLRGEQQLPYEASLYHKDGSVRRIEVSESPVFDDCGNVVAVTGLAIDITERKRTEDALRESEARYRDLVENASIWIWETDGNLRHVYTNLFVTACLGYQPGEFLAADIFSLIHAEDHGIMKELVCRATIERKGWSGVVLRWRHKDGSWRYIESSGTAIFNADGNLLGLRGVDRDVTERKRAEEALRESEYRFRQLAETIKEVFWLGAPDWSRIYYISPSYEQVWGRQCDALYHDSMLWLESVLDEDRKAVMETVPSPDFVWRGELRFPDYRIVRPDGSVRWISARAYPIRNTVDMVTGVAGIAEDITERMKAEAEKLELERQLMQAHRLESLGVLAGGIAHDFNNLLQGIFGYISMTKITLDQKEKAFAMLEQAEKALHQTVSLTTQLLTFSKGGKPVMKSVRLKPVIENIVKFALSGSRVDYAIDIDAALWTVEGDEGQIGQVIQNLVINADQAMPMGGRIVIRARNVQAPKGQIPVDLSVGNYVEISVQDSGIGIPKQYLESIFDPYFTTKEKGSGLGLAISYSIIRNHGGTIHVASEVGRGSTFSLYLPAISVSPVAAPSSREAAAQTRKGRVLLMDDEALVRSIATEMIKALGHEIQCCAHGEECVTKYLEARQQGAPFDVVILDMTIRGGMGGAETIKKLIEIDPQVKAVVSSGYADDSIIADHRSHGFSAALSKPYDIKALSNTLDALLAS